MIGAIADFIKSLFSGKGTTQIGSGNQSVTGDVAGPVAVGSGNVIHYHAAQSPSEKPVEYAPTPAEIEILRRLEKSSSGSLNALSLAGGFAIHIEGETLGGPDDPNSSVELHEAFERLLSNGCLRDIERNGEVFHLSSKGRNAAQQVQKQIESLERPDLSEIEALMPDLLKEMKEDYSQNPLIREMILLDSTGNVYNGGGVFAYYRSTHPDLDSQFRILENHGLVQNITYNNTDRYRVSEKFVRSLSKR